MTDFPSPLPLPNQQPWAPEDNAIRSDPEAGKVMTRRRFTTSRENYQPIWSNMSDTDMATLLTHYDTVETWGTFLWAPDGGFTKMTCRYYQKPNIIKNPAGWNQVQLFIETV